MIKSENKKVFFILSCFFLLLGTRAQNVKYSTNLPANMTPGQTFNLEVNISKGSLNSFAKFQMDLPAGFSATPTDIKGGNWTFDQQRAKIVWVSIPAEPNFTVKLKLTASKSTLSTAVINSKFFYLENNVKQEFELPPHTIALGSENNSKDNKTTATLNEKESSQLPVNVTENKSPEVKSSSPENGNVTTNEKAELKTNNNEPETKVKQKQADNNPDKTKPNGKIVYRLQIGAFASKPESSKFKHLKDFWYYEENGLFKVTTGKFATLNDAEAYKSEMKTKGVDGFVVSFENNVHTKLQ